MARVKGRAPYPKKNGENIIPHQFKKGQSGNPLGRSLEDPNVRALRRLTHKEVSEVGSLVLEGNIVELKKVSVSKTVSVLKKWFAGVALEAIDRKDLNTLDRLLDRIVGKVPEKIEVDSNNTNSNTHSVMDKAAAAAMIKKLESEV